MTTILEYERIVEYSFNDKQKAFMVRFLDGSSYFLPIDDLPKKLQTKSPDWQNAQLNSDNNTIIAQSRDGLKEIPFYVIHSKGRPV